jgi:hypothetical protein
MPCSTELPWLQPKYPWCSANLNNVAPWSGHRHKDTTHGMFPTQNMDQYQPPRATLQESMVLCKHKWCSTMVIPQAHRRHTQHVPQTSHGYTQVSTVLCKLNPSSTVAMPHAQSQHTRHVPQTSHRSPATPQVSTVLCKPKPCDTMVVKQACRHHTWYVPLQYMDQYQPPMDTAQVSMVLCKPKPCSTMAMPQAHRHHTCHVPPSIHGQASISHGYSPSVHGVLQA